MGAHEYMRESWVNWGGDSSPKWQPFLRIFVRADKGSA